MTGRASVAERVVVAEYTAVPGREDEVVRAVTEMVAASRAEPGCLDYRVQRDPDRLGRMLLFERYVDQAALDAHRGSAHFKRLVLGTIVPALTARTVTILEPLTPTSDPPPPPTPIPGRVRELLEGPNFAHVVTFGSNGDVHPVVAWVDVDGDDVLLNSAEGRAWPGRLRGDPRVVVTVPERDDPYEFAVIHGRMTAMTHAGADAHIDRLARTYLGKDRYPFRSPGEQRVVIRVHPERVRLAGGAH